MLLSLFPNNIGQANIVSITFDASLHGWGALVQWWSNIDAVVIVGHRPSSEDMQHQVRRDAEAASSSLAFDATSRLLNLRSTTCIIRNHARGALSSLWKGNYISTHLHS